MPDFAKALADTAVNGPLILDGAMGASLQTKGLTEADFDGLDGCNEVLVRTRPDVIRDLHLEFLNVGVDAVETDSFGGAPWVLDEYGLGKDTEELNRLSAAVAREACDQAKASFDGSRERFVVGSIGPGTKSPTLSLAKKGDEFDFIDTKTMVAGYVRQARGLLAGGSDLLLVETVFDLLQAKAAVVACHEAMALEGITVPVAVSVTIEANINTMLLGSDTSAALYALEAMGIDLIGLNCATGPQDMREHVRYLSEHSRVPIMVVPNAGLPENVNGQTCYRLTPEELAAAHHEFVTSLGVQMVGGCCGTTPAHLKAVVDAVRGAKVAERKPVFEPGLASLYSAVTWEQESSFHIIGERLNANGSKAFREHLLEGDMNAMLKIARTQTAEGANSLDVCVDYVGRDGVADMVPLVNQLATTSTLPLVVDSTEVAVIESALLRLGGRAVINSVNLEDGRKKADVLLPLAKQWGHAVIALAIDEQGQARTADWKVDVCKRIADIAINEYGMRAEDLVFDTLTFPLGSGAEDLRKDGMETIEAIRRVKEEIPGCLTTLGLSNVSFGLNPAARQVLNSVFLHHCIEAGLDSAIVHASKILPLARIEDDARIACEDLIFDRRGTAGQNGTADADYDPLMRLIELFEGVKIADAGAARLAEMSLEERLAARIIDAEREGLDDDLQEAMDTGIPPLDIINEHLLAGMKVVGERFGSGEMQLPFVLQSAETMKAAVAYLEPHMDTVDTSAKASIVLATVKGDVHDIGKNLVDIILSNNGFVVHNIGIKQPIDAIMQAVRDTNADAIGLSGLLVKSTVVMREDLEVLRAANMAGIPVLLGGAALNRAYVEKDLRSEHPGPLFYCKDAFSGLQVMEELAAGNMPEGWGREIAETRVKAVGVKREERDLYEVIDRTVDSAPDIPTPPFWGTRITRGLTLDKIAEWLNKTALFRTQWGFGAKDEEKGEQALRDVLARARTEGWLVPEMVHGWFRAASDGNDLLIWRHPDDEQPAHRLTFPRQTAGRRRCIADFFEPVDSGVLDVIGFQLVTMGNAVSERAGELFKADAYTDYLYTHGIGVEMAEALAEMAHYRARVELGIDGDDADSLKEIFRQGYRGSRYSFGYAACPDLEMRAVSMDLLEAHRIGVELSDTFQLHPEQSTDAFIVHHPDAKYFNAR